MSKQEVKDTEEKEKKNTQFVEQLNKTVREVFKSMNTDLKGVKGAVVVMGDTGVGKSTLINALIGKQLEVVNYGEGMVEKLVLQEDVVNEIDRAEIGHHYRAQTIMPKGYMSKNGVVYFDCPGLEDTRGPEQEITNGIFVIKLFSSLKEVKIVLVVSQNELIEGRTRSIIKLVTKLTEMFPDQSQIKDSISLVISKAGKKITSEKVKKVIERILLDLAEYEESTAFHDRSDKGPVKLNPAGQMLALLMKSNICVFKAPTEEGTYNFDQKIKESIEKTLYVKGLVFKAPISDHSMLLVTEAYIQMIKSDTHRIKTFIEDNLNEPDKLSDFMKLLSFKGNKESNLEDTFDIFDELFPLLNRELKERIQVERSNYIRTLEELKDKISKVLPEYKEVFLEKFMKASYDSVAKVASIMPKEDKNKLKLKIDSLKKLQDIEYIEKAAELMYETAPNYQTKASRNVLLESVKFIKDTKADLQAYMSSLETEVQKSEVETLGKLSYDPFD